MSDPASLRFGDFELNATTGELRQHGDLLKLAPQPFKVLELLARRAGQVLTRNEIRDHVWTGDTFVDFEQGLNFCIRQIREALGDTADGPRFIETLPRRGYRFLMPVKAAAAEQPVRVTRLMVLPFRMLRPDADTEFLAFSLPDALTSSLSGLQSLVVRSSMAAARFGTHAVDLKTLASEADVDVVVTGTLLRSGDQMRVASQLAETSTGTLLWSDVAQAPVNDVFQLQDELTRHIVASLSLPLTVREQQWLHRDVPSSAKAYDYFLRGNQLSYDSKQWAVARDLYERCVEEDPQYAPAWARLGRIHHVMGKYLPTGTAESLGHAEAALKRALELNPDLAVAHKLYAQVEFDLGRAAEAMMRLVARAQIADPELMAGLVSACRYCGLLDASVAAHDRAVALEPKIKTSLPHTWFLRRDHQHLATVKLNEYPYIGALALAALGRGDEALPELRDVEQKMPTRRRDFVTAARTLLEGDRDGSIAAIERVVASNFRDPEALFYLSRHLAHLNETDAAIDLLKRVVDGGFFCYPAIADDPWLSSVRKTAAFTKLLSHAKSQHEASASSFLRLGGPKVLGLQAH